MAEEILNNTTGEVGTNANTNSVDYESIVNNVIHAIEVKNAKNEKSIISSNFDKLSDDDRQTAYELFYAKKNAEAEKVKKAEAEKNKLFESMQKELAAYKTKEKMDTLTNAAGGILTELECTEEGSRKQAIKLAFSGIEADKYFDENNEVKIEDLKAILSATLSDVPSLVSKKQKTVNVNIGNVDEGNQKDEYERMLDAIGYKRK